MFRRVFATNTVLAVPVAIRMQSQGGNQNFRRNQNQNQGNNNLLQSNRMPPAFDIIKSNDEDLSAGYMMRVQYINTNVILNFMKQKKTNEDLKKDEGENSGARRGSKYERDGVTTMLLPALYAARVLSVLEGEQEKCELVHRYSSGSFAQGASDNHFVLNVKTVVAGKENEPHNWTCDFDPANALMFRRFLVQVLHQNAGF